MPKKFFKFRLLLDEGFHLRTRFPNLNNRYDVKHIASDLHKNGLPDEEVYALAVSLKRIIVTFNEKDFRPLASKSKTTGIIGISADMSTDQIDKKLVALLTRSKKSDIFGSCTSLSDETGKDTN
ncbi:MAG: DUF5615 family PIN-like protein [Nitrospiria bacterium]